MSSLLAAPIRTAQIPRWLRGVFVFGLIYVFLVGVSSLEAGINVMGADTQERLFSNVSNPVAGLFVGILGTVLVQSSSASTSVIVGLVASGALTVDQAVPMIMGANIGTTVTNTLVSLGHVRQSNEFRRALAAATVHDFFNLAAVAILLPLELATGFLSKSATWVSEQLVGSAGTDWESPVKAWVKRPVGWIEGGYSALAENVNIIGGLMVVTGLVIVLMSLIFITKNMKTLVAERVERSMNAILGRGAGIMAILVGALITVAVQSSSITTSILIPMSAAGVISLRNAYPVTPGANVGTTITALLAALAASRPEALTIGLVHTFFNIVGIVILFGVPFLRPLPIRAAELLADVAVERRMLAVGYVVTVFIIVPLAGIAILRCRQQPIMVMSFFRRSNDESGLEHIAQQTISMLGDARHSFDLASTVVLSGADPSSVGADIENTDRRINESEQRLRSELVVHIAVRGGDDIGAVLGYTLLLKKIERIGDQAKNIYELAADGVTLVGSDDIDEFVARRQEISLMYVEAADLLASQDIEAAKDFLKRSFALNELCGARVREYMHSDQPGSWAVPRAILYRYWKRIVANLAGVVTAAIEPLQNIDYLDEGETDITDD